MVKVRRGNVILRVADVDLQHYIDKGYSEIDANGNVIREAIPNDVRTLQNAFTEHQKKIQELEAEVLDLKEKLEKATAKKTKKAEPKE